MAETTLKYLNEAINMPPFTRFPPLSSYFRSARSVIFNSSTSTSPAVMLVMGNPSVDLDSFISAVVFSYFHNRRPRVERGEQKIYIPLLNLPKYASRDLWRIRPEFNVAVKEAMNDPEASEQDDEHTGSLILNSAITIQDLLSSQSTLASLKSVFQPKQPPPETKQDIILVDHNAPSIPRLSSTDISSNFSVVGVIDHHVEENYVRTSPDIKPRIIRTGIGSCTSLVVKYLRDEGLWPDLSSSSPTSTPNQNRDSSPPLDDNEKRALVQISKLALAPMLVDTRNLRATGDKCSDLDREMVSFLMSQINSATTTASQPSTTSTSSTPKEWNKDQFHTTLQSAKSNSLSLLSLPEMFERDYKEWSEKPSASTSNSRAAAEVPDETNGKDTSNAEKQEGQGEMTIGISSLPQPLSYLLTHTKNHANANPSSTSTTSITNQSENENEKPDDITEEKQESDPQGMISALKSFAHSPSPADDRHLSVLALLTPGTLIASGSDTGDKKKAKELFILTFSDTAARALATFDETAAEHLGLQDWSGDNEFVNAMVQEFGPALGQSEPRHGDGGAGEEMQKLQGKGRWKAYHMTDTSKSRKQVAPLLREAVRRS